MTGPSHAQLYRDAVWDSELAVAQRMVALVYADHARGTEYSWVVYPRLLQRSGIRSNATVAAAIRALVVAGWLVEAGHPLGNPRSVLYRLTIPTATASVAVPVAQTATASVADSEQTATVEGRNRDSSAPKPRQSRAQTPTAAVAYSLDSRDSLDPRVKEKDSRAATLRAAPSPEDQPAMPADEARALARAIAAKTRAADVHHRKAGTAPDGEPNPDYDSAVLAAAQAANTWHPERADAPEPEQLLAEVTHERFGEVPYDETPPAAGHLAKLDGRRRDQVW
jgi:hypothetical protein